MQNYDYEQSQAYDYRGKRGLILLRVSTEEQEKKYGFPSQLREIMEKVIKPRGIRILDPNKFIKYDTYTGMEFREREILEEILRMARNKEFDVLIMDVLDRLGRVGLPREIYRAELRLHGIRILTTKAEEHADDDSLMGQMIRLLHGFKAEEERNDIIRRTENGRRERVLKDHKMLGNHICKYGFKFKDEGKGAYVLDDDPIKIELDNGRILLDENGEPWTEVKVRRYMFNAIDQGESIRSIALYLSSQHIPTGKEGAWNASLIKRVLANRYSRILSDQPILAYGYLIVSDENGTPYTEASVAQIIYELHDQGLKERNIVQTLNQKHIPTGREASWTPAVVSAMLSDEFVIGKAAAFVTRTIRDAGHKRLIKLPKDEWVYLPEGTVPPILVTEDGRPDIAQYERVQKRLEGNQKFSARNNHDPYSYLLRGGFIKCSYCGGNMQPNIHRQIKTYTCTSVTEGRCKERNLIYAHIPEKRAWEIALEIIRDPSEVDRKIEALKKEDPNAERREYITGELAKVKAKQKRDWNRLEDEDLDDDTYSEIKLRLKELADLKRGYENELAREINIHEEWRKAQDQLKYFHKRCQEMREKIDDPEYIPEGKFKREAIEFFGITAWIRKAGSDQRVEIQLNPPSIVSHTI
jgi:DNA invertase Pin-like site-specific DNA recombinase